MEDREYYVEFGVVYFLDKDEPEETENDEEEEWLNS